MTAPAPTAKQEWQSNWTLVFTSAIGFGFFSVMLSTTGLFMEPVSEEFGWSRALYSSGVSIATLVTAILSPFFGVLIDRFGSRKLALPGVLLTLGSMLLFGLTNGQPWQWMLFWLIFGICAVTIKSTIWTAAVLGVFNKSKGLALGLTMAGTALAQVLVPPIGDWLITGFGWRAAYVWLALGWGSITFVLCFFFFFDIHDVAARKRTKDKAAAAAPAMVDLPGLTARQGARDWALWRVGISNFVVMVLTQGLAAHLIPILTDAGVSRTNAALLSSLGGVAGIVGKLVTGALLDRYRPNWIGGITLAANGLAFLFLLDGVRTPGLIVAAILINGYSAGTKLQICTYLTSSYAGLRNLGAVFGAMYSLVALGSGLGPLVAGFVYDVTGGYTPFLFAGMVGCVCCGLLVLTLPRYPDWQAPPTVPAHA